MTVWDDLTPVQADAVRATAAKHLRDTDELAEELAPLLTREIPVPVEEARTVVFTANVVAYPDEPSWSLLGTTENGSTFLFPSLSVADFTVNEPLTLTPEKEHTP